VDGTKTLGYVTNFKQSHSSISPVMQLFRLPAVRLL
jgi:hypothetical protein